MEIGEEPNFVIGVMLRFLSEAQVGHMVSFSRVSASERKDWAVKVLVILL